MSTDTLIANLLDTVNETADGSTEYKLCPPVSANATIKKWDLASGTRKSQNGETEEPWFSITFQWDIDSPEAREAIGRDTVLVSQNPIFITLNEQGHLSSGVNQNVALWRLIQLFDIPTAGVSLRGIFDSFVGQYAFVQVEHRAYQNKSNETVYSANVTRVGAAA